MNCCFDGVPLPRYGSLSMVLATESFSSTASWVSVGGSLSGSEFSTLDEATFSSEEVVKAINSLGWSRCHLVSGKKNTNRIKRTENMATLSHQKLRQPEWSAIGPEMIGPTWKHQMLFSNLNRSTYHER